MITFPPDSKKERVIGFIRKVRKKNLERGIISLDNLRSHKAEEVIKEADRIRIELVFPFLSTLLT